MGYDDFISDVNYDYEYDILPSVESNPSFDALQDDSYISVEVNSNIHDRSSDIDRLMKYYYLVGLGTILESEIQCAALKDSTMSTVNSNMQKGVRTYDYNLSSFWENFKAMVLDYVEQVISRISDILQSMLSQLSHLLHPDPVAKVAITYNIQDRLKSPDTRFVKRRFLEFVSIIRSVYLQRGRERGNDSSSAYYVVPRNLMT